MHYKSSPKLHQLHFVIEYCYYFVDLHVGGANESVAKNSKLFFISLQSKLDDDPEELEDFDDDEETKSNSKQTAVKKGLLWQQRDKLFSQWKERYFILTPDYLQCFKKGSSRMTEMGEFIFKVCYK